MTTTKVHLFHSSLSPPSASLSTTLHPSLLYSSITCVETEIPVPFPASHPEAREQGF
ncbi:hypothetical protein BT69DRAFT_1288080 [Atractiella rhizophila]|nr:hypothetical protein BT69DRAFT_1288080 [Atractiella rhizophila]